MFIHIYSRKMKAGKKGGRKVVELPAASTSRLELHPHEVVQRMNQR